MSKKSKNAENPTKQAFFSLQRKMSDMSSLSNLLDKDDDDPSVDVDEEDDDNHDPSANVGEEDKSSDEVTVEAVVQKKEDQDSGGLTQLIASLRMVIQRMRPSFASS